VAGKLLLEFILGFESAESGAGCEIVAFLGSVLTLSRIFDLKKLGAAI